MGQELVDLAPLVAACDDIEYHRWLATLAGLGVEAIIESRLKENQISPVWSFIRIMLSSISMRLPAALLLKNHSTNGNTQIEKLFRFLAAA